MLLQGVDMLWVDHLEAMEYLRSSVNLRAYGQRDPLVEYKKEGLRLFQSMEEVYIRQAQSALSQTSSAGDTEARAQIIHKAAETITSSGNVRSSDIQDFGRNDKVVITDGTETRELKFKKAEALLASGKWHILEK
jgi:preprotein translocase subunit SecA